MICKPHFEQSGWSDDYCNCGRSVCYANKLLMYLHTHTHMYTHKQGGVPMFVRLLSSEHQNVIDQAVWALGNIAGDGAECRDFTIRCGIVQPLIALIKPDMQVKNVLSLLSITLYGY